MTFNELKEKYDKYDAFFGWTTVAKAKYVGYIPEKFAEYFDDKCTCGSENIITSSLTQEMCCDPNCSVKIGYRLSKLFSSFSVKGVGPATCATVYRALTELDRQKKANGEKGLLSTNSYIEILAIPWDEYPMSCKTVAGSAFFVACCEVRERVITFPDLIGKLGLTSLGSSSSNLFSGINSFDELREEILRRGGVKQFCLSRGVKAPMIMFNVAMSLEDIGVASIVFHKIRRSGLQRIDVCMTGRVILNGTSLTKAAFIDKCNALCTDENGVQIYEIRNTSAVMSVPFILYSVESNSSKFRHGLQRGKITDEFGEHSVLLTADEFYKLLGGKMQKWNTQIKNSMPQVTSQMDSQTTSQMGSQMTSF